MRIMIIGASQGLGRALIDGLGNTGDTLIGVSRTVPDPLPRRDDVIVDWVPADAGQPAQAARHLAKAVQKEGLDVLIYNLGLWENRAFEEDYRFLDDPDDDIQHLVAVNITATLLVIKALLPALLQATAPRILLTGSTSGLPGSGRPEVTFGASKFALRGMAEALREGFRGQGLAVSCLQLGHLNTDDPLTTPCEQAAQRGDGTLIPLHDVVSMVRSLLALSPASYVRELVLPAIADPRF
ncbi:short-subunit dehydrogenase [Alloalcanivorax xenomutans]|uniref:SDR family NAD(P)-dependent oxidoreductase n=1 Tax=Alcanivoracaceae TaxID=224372 RepID=UPI000BC3ED3F|nr:MULTISPECIES: SDR family oxidoreductase [Alcanivoracaceae]SOC26951.1 short-subunit dehydrogenase [Alloalcanivorax xenomutans]